MHKKQTESEFEKLKDKMIETWDNLTESDIRLYNTKREKFFSKLKEYHGLARKDAEKKIKALEKACGYRSTNRAA